MMLHGGAWRWQEYLSLIPRRNGKRVGACESPPDPLSWRASGSLPGSTTSKQERG